jgi:excinuclease ABC subunit C
MTDTLKAKLATLPAEPGVYFHKDAKGKIIYIGKAAVLKNRVNSYFLPGTKHGPKNQLLVADIADTDWIVVGSEVEALFMESEFIKRYKPKYNVLLRDDKHWIYIKITTNQPFPVVSYVRRPMDDQATYFGPFTSSDSVRRAMKLLRKIFPYITDSAWPKISAIQHQIGISPPPDITSAEYKRQIRQLMLYLKGDKTKLLAELQRDMQKAAKKKDYETAARYRDKLYDLQSLGQKMVFGDEETFDLSLDQALMGLADRLDLKGAPRRIEAYDISHMQGTDNVASMVVFVDGVPGRDQYRHFKMRLKGNDDFAHMREVIDRRFSGKNLTDWPKPDLLLIDGGKGQLASALSVLDEKGINIPAIGLAKREEEIIRRRADATPISRGHYEDEAWVTANIDFEVILLPPTSHVLQLLQRVRDEAHRFAVTYHALLRGKRATKSTIDDLPGIGPATRTKLVKTFGSLRGVSAATEAEVAEVIGASKAKVIKEHLS